MLSPQRIELYFMIVALICFLLGIIIAVMGIFAPYKIIMESGAFLNFLIGAFFIYFVVYVRKKKRSM